MESILQEESIVLVALLMEKKPWQVAYCEKDLPIDTENEFTL